VNSSTLLAEVLKQARKTVGRSPEQVGEQTGVNGRTIRRLEDGESVTPRATTLTALANFYGLDGKFLMTLASSSGLDSGQLRSRLQELAGPELSTQMHLEEDDDLESWIGLAMRLARKGSPPPPRFTQMGRFRNDAEMHEALAQLLGLDRRRRRLAMELIRELYESQSAEPVGPNATDTPTSDGS
jgi:transcriptional regulator with XRE-family HTH domain